MRGPSPTTLRASPSSLSEEDGVVTPPPSHEQGQQSHGCCHRASNRGLNAVAPLLARRCRRGSRIVGRRRTRRSTTTRSGSTRWSVPLLLALVACPYSTQLRLERHGRCLAPGSPRRLEGGRSGGGRPYPTPPALPMRRLAPTINLCHHRAPNLLSPPWIHPFLI